MGQPRPHKRTDFDIQLLGPGVERGWADCIAAARNAMADAWDQLTLSPLETTPRQYQLKADAATRLYRGSWLPQLKYKFTDGGRIIHLVDETPARAAGSRRQDARGVPAAGLLTIVLKQSHVQRELAPEPSGIKGGISVVEHGERKSVGRQGQPVLVAREHWQVACHYRV